MVSTVPRDVPAGQARARISPLTTTNHPSGWAAHSRQARASSSSSSGVANPRSSACCASVDWVIRSAHRPPHHVALLRGRVAPGARRGGHVLEPRGMRPRQQVPGGRRFRVVAPGHVLVDGEPVVEPRGGGVPDHRRVVGVAHGDEPARPAYPAHLPQGGDRVAEVLEHLVRVDDVDRVVGQVEVVDVADAELGRRVAPRLGVDAGGVQRVGDDVEADDAARRHGLGEVEGDGPRPAPDVEQAHARGEVREEVCGGVRRRAPLVRAQHRLVVAVGVACPAGSPAHRAPLRTGRADRDHILTGSVRFRACCASRRSWPPLFSASSSCWAGPRWTDGGSTTPPTSGWSSSPA